MPIDDIEGPKIVLTVMHLDHQPENCDDANLLHACQGCHNRYDAPVRAAGIKARRKALNAEGDLFYPLSPHISKGIKMAKDSDTWLIACERSGVVRDAMIAAGYNAISCDLYPTRRPGPHLQMDVRKVLERHWGGIIAHPDCTFLTNAGVRWLYKGGRKENGVDPDRWKSMEEGCEFYKLFCEADHIPLRAVENPIMHEYAAEIIGHRADQFVHPWWFGSPFQKATGLRLYNLPKLPRERAKSSYDPPPKQEVWLMGPSEDREEKRSKTDDQVGRAMAQYWGPLLGYTTLGGPHLSDPNSFKGEKSVSV